MTIHVVQRGETVSAIAAGYGVDPARVMSDNDVPPDGALAVGQTLVIRFPRQVHAVEPGETLYTIARDYGIPVRQLWQNNWALGGGTALEPGQVLVISYFDEKLGQGVFNGYAYPFIDRALLSAVAPYQSALTPFTYGISASGGLLPLDDDALLAAARAHGAKPVMHLSTYTEDDRFDVERAELVLTDQAVQTALIGEIQATMARKGFAGLDVDFEYLPGTLADAYAAFLGRLRRLLGAQGWFVWAALAPKTSAGQPGLLYEGHNYAKVGAAVDAVLLMTYEWGYTYGPPMAVAPLPNVRAVLDYAVTEIPPEKIMLGVPNYGYDWPLPFVRGTTKAETIGNVQAVQRAIEYGVPIQFSDSARSPFYFYENVNIQHEVWFEDVRSMDATFELIKEYGLRGAGYWNLMRLFRTNWLLLSDRFVIL